MFGIEHDYCNVTITALLEANGALLELSASEAVKQSHVPHKGDTLGLDQVPENTIAGELTQYDQYAILITEERGEEANPLATSTPEAVHGARTFFCCDPCDRSNQLKEFLEQHALPGDSVGSVLKRPKAIAQWEQSYHTPVQISGADAAITCVRRGLPICSVLLNYMSQQVTIACSAGIYQAPVPKQRVQDGLRYVREHGRPLTIQAVPREQSKRFTTFLGKPERGYPQNFTDCRLLPEDELKANLHYDLPGGPTRILYLTENQPAKQAIGFIVANGEKIGEWIHWLPFIRFAPNPNDRSIQALSLFEISQEQSLMRDGYLMTPSAGYSVFKAVANQGVMIDVEHLRRLANPSKYRATLLVAPTSNRYIISRAQQYGYRQLAFTGD